MRGLNVPLLIIAVCAVLANAKHNANRYRRSIELSSAQKLITDYRLPTDIVPESVSLDLYPDMATSTFTGKMKVNITWKAETKAIELHAHYDLNIDESNVRVRLLKSPYVISSSPNIHSQSKSLEKNHW